MSGRVSLEGCAGVPRAFARLFGGCSPAVEEAWGMVRECGADENKVVDRLIDALARLSAGGWRGRVTLAECRDGSRLVAEAVREPDGSWSLSLKMV